MSRYMFKMLVLEELNIKYNYKIYMTGELKSNVSKYSKRKLMGRSYVSHISNWCLHADLTVRLTYGMHNMLFTAVHCVENETDHKTNMHVFWGVVVFWGSSS